MDINNRSPRQPMFPRALAVMLLSGLALGVGAKAAAQQLEWVEVEPRNNNGITLGGGLACDASGNVYMSATFHGPCTFGTTVLEGIGGTDAAFFKYDADGSFAWAQTLGGSDDDGGGTPITDAAGNVYLMGSFRDTAAFGSMSATSAGDTDLFLAKFNAAGVIQWLQTAGGVERDYPSAFASDKAGNLYLAGHMGDTAMFGSTTLTSASGVFLAKYDASGTLLWLQTDGGNNTTIVPRGIDVDPFDNIYFTGAFRDTVTFGAVSLVSAGETDIYLTKYDSDGTLLWARSGGGVGYDHGYSVVTDLAGNVYLNGAIDDAVTFGTVSLTQQIPWGLAVVKYDAAGTVQWGRDDIGQALATDAVGRMYAGLPTLARYDAGGSLDWTTTPETSADGNPGVSELEFDQAGNLCVSGVAEHGLELGAYDFYLGKYSMDLDSDGLEGGEVVYMSPADNTTLGGVSVADEDIVGFDEASNTYSMLFDGSDVGLGAQDLDAFSMRADGSILMSFGTDFGLAGVGTARKQDIVRFVPSSLGATTAGTFQPFFIGRDHGLTASNANITGLHEASDGRLFLSFGNSTNVSNMTVATEDIVQFNFDGNDYSMVFDGSDVGLAPYSLAAFNFERDGSLLLSLTQYPTATGFPPGLPSGTKHDVFAFVPTSFPDAYGPDTAGTYHPFFVGSKNQAPASLRVDGVFRKRNVEPEVYQAEWGVLAGGSLLASSSTGFVGAGYVTSSVNGGSLEFQNVHGGSGGTKVLRFRSALGTASARTGRLRVNGVPQTVTFTPTGSWTNWAATDVAVTLAAGSTNTIRLESTGQGLAYIDQLQVVALYQAESGTLGGGSMLETVNTGFTGSAYVNSSPDGSFLELRNVDGGSGGPRMLRVRNALGSSSRSGRLVINGIPEDVTFLPTGSWTTWTTRDVPVLLGSGTTNTIRFESTGADLANIDQIEIH
jgi:hypothetical protein